MSMQAESISYLGINHPLLVDSRYTKGTATANPSILNYKGSLYIVIRMLNYTLYHSIGAKEWMQEGGKYQSRWGPLTYVHPQTDNRLITDNFFGKWEDGAVFKKINMTLDEDPIWDFVGLEDARLVHWDEKIYITGVRRDTTETGQGRMELSQIVNIHSGAPNETSRVRIEHPTNPSSYCEKNWMPVKDLPFHYVMDANPLRLVKANPKTGESEIVVEKPKVEQLETSMRGSSQVHQYKGNFITIVHDTNWWRFQGRCAENKDAIYSHRIVVWDKDWNLKKVSKQFTFMNGQIEFCCGMEIKDDKFYITFGFEDNSAHLLEIECNVLDEWFENNLEYNSER